MFWITCTLFATLAALDAVAGGSNDVVKNLAGQFFHGGRIGDVAVDSVDPLYVKECTLHCETAVTTLDIHYTEAYMHGLSTLTVEDASIKVDGSKVVMTAKTFTPRIKILAQYRGQGKVLHFDCNKSSGSSVTMFDRVNGVHTLYGTVGCDDRLHVDDYKVTQCLGEMHVSYQNLLGGGIPGLLAEKMIHANQKDIKKDLGPELDKELGKALKEHAVKVYSCLPWSKMIALVPKSG